MYTLHLFPSKAIHKIGIDKEQLPKDIKKIYKLFQEQFKDQRIFIVYTNASN